MNINIDSNYHAPYRKNQSFGAVMLVFRASGWWLCCDNGCSTLARMLALSFFQLIAQRVTGFVFVECFAVAWCHCNLTGDGT